jgi:hypothetical protein
VTPESDQYCRDLEAHLCRQNGGHLVRIVGPAFDLVRSWFEMGIPFNVACQGIDRHIARAASRATASTRRRPVRLEFCEHDVLDAFDAWRRAVGLRGSAAPGEPETEPAAAPDDAAAVAEPRRTIGLPAHLERTIARLTGLRIGAGVLPAWSAALESIIRQLDALVAPARSARGDAREAILVSLARIDGALLTAVREHGDPAAVAAADVAAAADLAPFRSRLSADDYDAALGRAQARALRTRLGLPVITLE